MHIGLVSLHTNPLAVAGSANAGGLNVTVRNLASGLARRGHQVDLITRQESENEPFCELLEANLRLLRIPAGSKKLLSRTEQSQLIGTYSQALLDFLATPTQLKNPYDIIHAHYWISACSCLPLAKAHKAKLVVSFHTLARLKNKFLSPGQRPESDKRDKAEVLAARAADLVLAISGIEQRSVAELLGTSADENLSVAVSPNGGDKNENRRCDNLPHLIQATVGVDTDIFSSRQQPPLPDLINDLNISSYFSDEQKENASKNGYFILSGRLQPLKGQDLAIKALSLLAADSRPAIFLVGDDLALAQPGNAERAALNTPFQAAPQTALCTEQNSTQENAQSNIQNNIEGSIQDSDAKNTQDEERSQAENPPTNRSFADLLRINRQKLGLQNHVVFLPAMPQTHLAALMSSARAVLMPSYSETFGLTALEAAACGTPVIAANTSGLKISVKDKKTGVLVPDYAPQTWAKAIAEFAVLSPNQRQYFREQGQLWAAQHSWDAFVNQTLAAYQGLFASK